MALNELPLSAEDCAIGEVVAGKYLIEGVIGRGSMGVVVRATHLGFDELVALKFIRPEMRRIDGIVARFAREAKASVRIRNEHAVNVLDVGVAEPIGPFFVMEYLEGINLEELVDSQGPFDTATAVKYVLEACEALAAAHAQGIIHRDIKPQNLFLAWQGRLEVIKVLDFGISKAALRGQMFGDDLSSREHDWVMGTPLYMSPEQLRHAPDIDERTDIWSLGAVLYELLCGQPLFSGDTQTEVCRQVLEVGTRSLRAPAPDVPDALWQVIERCLAPDKEQRYASVAELGQALLPFAPSGSSLHVDRARALLGMRPLGFFDDADEEEEIEDIDVEPMDDAPLAAPPSPPPRRPPSWVEVAVPVLAGAVAWIGLQQCQSAERAGLPAIETQTHALEARPECPPPAAASTPARAGEEAEGGSPAPSAREALSPAPSGAAPDPAADGASARGSADARPEAAARASREAPRLPLVGPSEEEAERPAAPPAGAERAGAGTPAGDERAPPAPQPPSPASAPSPSRPPPAAPSAVPPAPPRFRLIEDLPGDELGLVSQFPGPHDRLAPHR